MAATFVEINPEQIVAMLSKAGFVEINPTGVFERVFARRHGLYNNVEIRVYTSIDKRGGYVRGKDEDRIMVCAFYTQGKGAEDRRTAASRFLFSAQGVNRCSKDGGTVGADLIVKRALDRMRETYQRVSATPRCAKCGEPLRFSKSKKRSTRDGNANPNFGRAYVACMSENCFFKWDVTRDAALEAIAARAPAKAPAPAKPALNAEQVEAEMHKMEAEADRAQTIREEYLKQTSKLMRENPKMTAREAHGIIVNCLAGKCPDGCCGDEENEELDKVLKAIEGSEIYTPRFGALRYVGKLTPEQLQAEHERNMRKSAIG